MNKLLLTSTIALNDLFNILILNQNSNINVSKSPLK